MTELNWVEWTLILAWQIVFFGLLMYLLVQSPRATWFLLAWIFVLGVFLERSERSRKAALPSYETVEVIPQSLVWQNGNFTGTADFNGRLVLVYSTNQPNLKVNSPTASPLTVHRYCKANKEYFVMEE